MDFVTDVGSHKCAYDRCQCRIPAAEEFCSAYCADAGDISDITDVTDAADVGDMEDVDTECGCEHPACDVVS